ncbi:hypothetical protein B0H66DRAFT_518973 [Apodospora peruviana]|uniref:Arf-GAP domain-containing protein n=1 Tax=Apodospora peruviana TaxID=516989 RepID=A0AAE0M204_9PEZI|nr:hypothetical protein B0H66DRAFT_518973 [Apodospora peruviana]
MSRRPPNPAAERAAKNQATIKSLLKLESNKVCADCKRNKHPRWASWNLGVFVCIRCSGIHRGMGTHISRVKSVDLDSWTDEQLQSILNWGNARANKYWEAKLAPGHMPSEAKIENFIRTKYELKRWVMDGPMPDPATLDTEGDDDVPLSVVKEQKILERRESVRKASGQSSAPRSLQAPGSAPAPQADLIGGGPVPQRASTTGPAASKVPPKAGPAPPKATSTKDSLLGLDFLGTETTAPPRPASTTGTPGNVGQSRPDLKQSILSLYATAPRPQPQPALQQVSHVSSGSVSGMSSPGMSQAQGSFGGLNDAFSGLSFASSPPATKSPTNDAFSNLGSFSSSRPAPQSNNSAFSGLGGGGFFDVKPAAQAHQSKPSFGSGFGAFTSSAPAPAPVLSPNPPAAKPAAVQPASSALGDLFDFSTSSPPRAAANPAPAPAPAVSSVFNLSANQSKSPLTAPAPTTAANPMASLSGASAWSGSDVWGGNAWSTPEAPKKSPELPKPPVASTTSNDFGWASASSSSLAAQPIVLGSSGGFAPAPKVAADEEFGGWTSSTGAPTTTTTTGGGASKAAGGFGASEDLFSNVWE